MRKYERWMKMKLLPNLCPEEEEWPAPWPWPPPPPIAAGSNVRATLGYINILRLASFIFLNHNMRCLRQCKKGFPYLVSLGFGFEVWLSSYRWRRGGDIRRSVQVRVWRSHWLGGDVSHLTLEMGNFCLWILCKAQLSTWGGPVPVGGLGGGGWGACWPPRNAWSLDTWGLVDSGAGAGGILNLNN